MKIAVTYENGNVFQHFGHTEEFIVFDIEDGAVAGEEILPTDGAGHEALAGFLAGKGIEVLLCGGMGQGAKDALDASGIEVISGVQGNVYTAVAAYLNGELVSAGINCDHHHEHGHEHGHDHGEGHACGGHGHEHSHDHGEGHACGGHEDGSECNCGDDCGSSCGGGCGGCGGGCGGGIPPVIFEGPNAGKICHVHYTGTLNDGEKFDSSYDRGEPLQFICGVGMMIPGFDKAVVEMEVGQIIDIHLMPEDAYGYPDPMAIMTIPMAEMPGSEDCEVGQRVFLQGPGGQPIPVIVAAMEDGNITFDANSEMAGKELNFKIELVKVEETE